MPDNFLSILLFAQSAGDSIAAPSVNTTQASASFSLWDLIVKGGPVMIPIGLLSIATVYLFVERYLFIKKAGKMQPNFMNNIRDFILNNNIESAKLLCKNNPTPIGRMVEKGINRIGRPIKEIEGSIENVGKVELGKIEKNVGFLGTIAGIAPMFGFLGTIFGVIKIFYNISLADNISIGLIAGGLYEKMVTSAAGLMIGILAFIAHHILVSMIERNTGKMETAAIEFLDILQEPSK